MLAELGTVQAGAVPVEGQEEQGVRQVALAEPEAEELVVPEEPAAGHPVEVSEEPERTGFLSPLTRTSTCTVWGKTEIRLRR